MLEFYFCSEVSAFASVGQTGVVVLSADYDASDAAPTSKQEVLDTDPHTVPCLPSVERPIILKLDCKSMRSSDAKYVRPAGQPANTDLKTYDAGNLYVTTSGNSNTNTIGELHVRYRCKLKKPVLDAATYGGSNGAHWSSNTASSANNFAGAVLQSGSTGSPAAVTLGPNNTISWPAGNAGNYLVLVMLEGGTSVTQMAGGTPPTFTGGVSGLNILTTVAGGSDSASIALSQAGITNEPAFLCQTVTVTSSAGTMTFAESTIVTSGAGRLDVFIFQLPNNLITEDEKEQAEINDLRARADEQDAKIEKLMALLTPSLSPMVIREEDVPVGASTSSPPVKRARVSADDVLLVGTSDPKELSRGLLRKLMG
jgi:hypothetical protein